MTTDLTGLVRALDILPQYWHALSDPDAIDGYSQLIPENVLPELQREIEESLRPASRQEIAKAVVVVVAIFKIPTNAIQDKEAYFQGMRRTLGSSGYPADTINEAIFRLHARPEQRYTPATGEIVEIAKQLTEERRRRLRAVQQMVAEHRRRRRVAAERKVEAEREAKREAGREANRQAEVDRLRKLEAQARERFADNGPLPGDVELADSLSPSLARAGRRVSWQAALAEGEPWAVQYCRQMALAARVRRAHERGRVSWDEALSVAKLIVANEAGARHRINDMEGRAAEYQDSKLTEGFWRAIWKIVGACGLDTPVFPEDAAAAAIDNLKHLTGLTALTDTRPILDRQVIEVWEARRAARLALREKKS
jgi:hypothetical protein